MTTFVQRAMEFAVFMHADQKYGNFPYIVHLSDVVKNLRLYDYDDDDTLAAGFLHDVMEDCHVTELMLAHRFSDRTAKLVDAVTGVGANRKERKASTLSKLPHYPKAIPLKMADRLANIENCHKFNSRLLEMYKKEFEDYDEMFESTNHKMNKVIRKYLKG